MMKADGRGQARSRASRPARERRRPKAQGVLRRVPFLPALPRLRRSLDRALRRLQPAFPGIDEEWRRLVRRLSPTREEFDALTEVGLRAHLGQLRASRYDEYLDALRREGRALALRGVPEEHVLLSVAFHLEGTLTHLLQKTPQDRELVLALVRLHSAVQRSLLSGYATTRVSDEQRGEDQDRRNLSRDLHDEVGGDLVVLKLYLEVIAMELDHDRARVARDKIDEALTLTAHALESVRRLTLDLGPDLLDRAGLVPAVRLYSRRFSARTGIAVTTQATDVPDLSAGQAAALYRVLQGALSNVAKHAKARAVRVSLSGLREAVVVMVIEDDGVGFDVKRETSQRAFGLTAMRERVESLGGRVHIDSHTTVRKGKGGTGTRIEVDLPLRREE